MKNGLLGGLGRYAPEVLGRHFQFNKIADLGIRLEPLRIRQQAE